MSAHAHFSSPENALTVEAARRALYLWLWARREGGTFTVTPAAEVPQASGWREELRWLGLDWDAEAGAGESPAWLRSLPRLEECEPSPWGQWSGRTAVAELRTLGVLPEALLHFLALSSWRPPEAARETLSRAELQALWSPEGLLAGPMRFDFELLRRINHAWLERADLDRLAELALPYYRRAGWLPPAFAGRDTLARPVRAWLRNLIRAVLPGLDFLSLLPPRTRLVFDYQPESYLRVPESREAMEREGAREVVRAFGQRSLEESWLTGERFRTILEEVKQETHWKGRNLHQPIRVMLTGLPFGPALDELIPLIEQGAELDLPAEIKSCRQRVLEFCSVFV
ncbi:MAG: hypothetical protein ACE5IP_04955 [Terriglobia bacterium]